MFECRPQKPTDQRQSKYEHHLAKYMANTKKLRNDLSIFQNESKGRLFRLLNSTMQDLIISAMMCKRNLPALCPWVSDKLLIQHSKHFSNGPWNFTWW